MFIVALFTIGRTWKQPRCPSTDEWIKKLWYIYTMEYYSAIKRNEFDSVIVRWINLEPIILSKVSQRKTDIIYSHKTQQWPQDWKGQFSFNLKERQC